MSALMRRHLLDKAGGFPAFGCYLAEDFFFAKSIQVSNGSIIRGGGLLALEELNKRFDDGLTQVPQHFSAFVTGQLWFFIFKIVP
jgi:hypothetical protein